MNDHWVVVQTKPAQEKWAAENIQNQGCEVYFPKTMEIFKDKRTSRLHERIRPVFPRYLFVKLGPQMQWRFLLSTYGVTDLIMDGTQPTRLPIAEVVRMKAWENEKGLVVLPEHATGPRKFQRGDGFKVRGGPLQGLAGIYQGSSSKDCVRVLLDYMNQKIKTTLPEELLERI